MQYNWTPYAIGGATRPDSFSSMTPAMQQGLYGLLQAADAELGPGLQVYSGYRSPELQAKLFEDALAKYGSEKAARKWVAPPGRSKHNSGQAADLKYNGVRIDKLASDHPVRQWLAKNVSRFGLSQPMSWEPWQVEAAGARGQQLGPTQALADSGQPLATRTPQTPPEPLLVDFGLTPPSDTEQKYRGLAQMAASMSQPAPAPPMMLRQSQPYQPAKRDTVSPYLALFQSLKG